MTLQPWTFSDFEMDETETYMIFDPNLGHHFATFFDRAEAEKYLKWRNKKQKKRRTNK
jgi:hypothetical protein